MGDIWLPENQLLNNFAPRLREIVKETLKCGQVGISLVNMKIRFSQTNIKGDRDTFKDHFILEIPFAGKTLHWEVFFNSQDYSYAPDFFFLNDDFLDVPDIDVISTHIPSLANWNANNPKSLVLVIRELLHLYKQFQLEKLHRDIKYIQLFNQYELLRTQTDCSIKDGELFVDNSNSIHILISINVDFSSLPPYIQPILVGEANAIVMNPLEDTAMLLIIFSRFYRIDSCQVHCDLHLSPRLQQVLGNSTNLHLPKYNSNGNLCEYTTQVKNLLNERVEQIATHYKMKNLFISSLLSVCGYSIVEYDNSWFSKATLLCDVNNYYTFVSIEIGNKFPQEKPKVVLHSIYHLQNDKTLSQNMDNYLYNSQLKADDMVKDLLVSLQAELPKFQRYCQNIVK